MKKFIVILVAVIVAIALTIPAYAQKPAGAKPQGKKSIEDMKEKIISSIDERIKTLQEEKACVSAAQTHEDLKKCRKKLEKERKEFREEKRGREKRAQGEISLFKVLCCLRYSGSY